MSDDTIPPITRLTRAAQAIENPVVKIIDRFLMWAVVGMAALMVLGGKTWLSGYISDSPPMADVRKNMLELVTAQRQSTQDIQNLTTSVRLLTQESSQHERRIE